LLRRASLRTTDWDVDEGGPPVACPSGIVVGAHEEEKELEELSAILDARKANPYHRTPRVAVGIDTRSAEAMWRRTVAYGPWDYRPRTSDPYVAVDMSSGSVAWRRPLEEAARSLSALPTELTVFFLGLASGHVIFRAGSRVVAFSCESGEHVWTAEMYLVDPRRGSASRHRIPRTEPEVAVELHGLLCLAEGYERILVLEGVDGG
jgi:hypothetical protein